jgi:Ca-activated chloride channel family protein
LESALHFTHPGVFWLLLLPFPVWVWLTMTASISDNRRIRDYADPDLLPHLMHRGNVAGGKQKWGRFAFWTFLWTLLIGALAGPRMGYTDVQLFRPDVELVVLLDISGSMRVEDVKPSRLARARQEVEDLLKYARGVRIGLVVFATAPHVISPVTEDTQGIRRLLPAISTELATLQGSRVTDALGSARALLSGEGDDTTRSILLISDGDFAEPGLQATVRGLSKDGIRVHTMGVGTLQGGSVPAPDGRPMRGRDGKSVQSQMNERLLQSLAEAGGGEYINADFRSDDTLAFVDRIASDASVSVKGAEQTRIWHEQFYWLIGILILALLPEMTRFTPGLFRSSR